MRSSVSYGLDDTIAAIATAPGGAARAIIRIAGPDVVDVLSGCFAIDDGCSGAPTPGAPSGLKQIKTPQVLQGNFALPESGRQVPCELYLWPDQRSFTRSPLAELHLVGSPPLAAAILRALGSLGARLAEPGEFTLRAFLAGRIDLTQAEAVLGVIDAGCRQDMDVALQQLAGGLSQPLTRLRESLLDLLAHIEAGLDFVEEDISFIESQQTAEQLAAAQSEIRDLVAKMQGRTHLSDAVRVVLVGSPNVGKSSLFNRLIERQGAIVSAVPGTTRDYLSAAVDMNGLVCELVDTAGVETDIGQRSIAASAQQMTEQQQRTAHLRLLCLDATRKRDDWERQQLRDHAADQQLIVLTKCDATAGDSMDDGRFDDLPSAIRTSSRTGVGIDALKSAVRALATAPGAAAAGVVSATAIRCRDSLQHAANALQSAIDAVVGLQGDEIVAAEIRLALDELGLVAGAVHTDDLLDRIFSRFCIGK